MRRREPDINVLMEMKSFCMPDARHRNMLDNIRAGCQIEAESTGQGGTVISVTRNRHGIPVCAKVRCGEYDELTDYISLDRVTWWKPCGKPMPDDDYFTDVNKPMSDEDEDEDWREEADYLWDDEKQCYVDEKGEEAIW